MSTKQLLISIIAVVVLIVITVVILNKDSREWAESKSGGKALLVKDLDVNKVKKIEIKDGKKSASVTKIGDTWVVSDRSGYPADFQKVGEFIIKISKLTVAQNVKVGKSQFDRLELLAPGEKNGGKEITLSDESGKALCSLIVGKTHKASSSSSSNNNNPMMMGGSSGKYVLVSGSESPVLISDMMYDADSDPSDWLNKDFIKIENVSSIVRKSKDKVIWELTKPKKNGDFELIGLKEDEELEKSNINSVTSAFDYLSIEDIKSKKGDEGDIFAKSDNYTFSTYDGFKYNVKVASIDGKGYLTFKVSADIKEKRVPAKDEKKKDKAKLDKDFADKVQKLKDKLEKETELTSWVFQISNNKVENLTKKREDLFKKKEKKEDAKKDGKKEVKTDKK